MRFWGRAAPATRPPPVDDLIGLMAPQVLALGERRQPLELNATRPTLFVEPEGLFYASMTFSEAAAGLRLPEATPDFTLELADEEELLLVFLNPQLDELLAALQLRVNTIIYTATQRRVAEAVLQRLGVHRLAFAPHRLFQEDCLELHLEAEDVLELAKSLAGLGVSPERAVLLDNRPFAFMLESANAYVAPAFAPHAAPNPVDRLLGHIEQLARAADVRPLLAEWFNVRATLLEANFLQSEA